MNYVIHCADEPIGTLVESAADRSMGVIRGRFVPLTAYEKVRPIFRLFAQAAWTQPTDEDLLHRYYRERDALPLSVATATGLPVAVEWVHIEDYTEEAGGEPTHEAVFVVSSPAFFEDGALWEMP